MFLYLNLLLFFIAAVFGIYCELIFIETFKDIISGKRAEVGQLDLIVSAFAPITIVGYNVCAYIFSISLSNRLLSEINFKNEQQSDLKLLVEDYNMSLEVFCPSLLFFYRFILLFALFFNSIIQYLSTISTVNLLLSTIVIFLLFLIFVIVIRIGKSFSRHQSIRMELVKEIIAKRKEKIDFKDQNNLSAIHWQIFLRKLLVGITVWIYKPLIDLMIILIAIVYFYFDISLNFQNELYVALGLTAYRASGPIVNIFNNFNQVTFAWNALSETWQKAMILNLKPSRYRKYS
tara:strand:- start:3621 stop:4490 length:870 start_codon:yes stop_codon:yes gene_type:complete